MWIYTNAKISGFTLLELVAAIVVMGPLGVLSLAKRQAFEAMKLMEAERSTVAFYMKKGA